MRKQRKCIPCGRMFDGAHKPKIFKVCPDCEAKTTICICGCGIEIPAYTVRGSNRTIEKGHAERIKATEHRRTATVLFCACGCGQVVPVPSVGKGRGKARYIKGHVLRVRFTANCTYCGTDFEITEHEKEGKRFCSQQCYDAARKPPPQECPNCKTIWQPGKGSPRGQGFCSKSCWYEWHTGQNHAQYTKITLYCAWCNKEIKRTPYRLAILNYHYCSRKCSDRDHSIKMRKFGAGSPSLKAFYSLSEWRTLRKIVLARDNFCCVICGITNEDHKAIHKGRGLHVDHIEPRRVAQVDDLSNLQTLCASHHAQKTGVGL